MMFRLFLILFPITTCIFLSACGGDSNEQESITKSDLGEMLFNDQSLSADGTQSCASCHDAEHAFVDPRVNITSVTASTPGAVSLGQDDTSLGDINTPSAAYAAFVPSFHFDQGEERFKGGMFFNGRSADLVEQAKQPFLNPLEMQSTKEEVVNVVTSKYYNEMTTLYGNNIFDSVDSAFDAIADSIAEFERSEALSTFDSKFDRMLRDEAVFTDEETQGLALFMAEDRGNCASCHPVPELNSSKEDSLFTDFTYDNLGVPKNILVRESNGLDEDFVDEGLFANPEVNDPDLRGAFRTSTLRNIAVTGPYMHNGVFENLSTVVHFYNSRDVPTAFNPETNEPWRSGEIDETKNTDKLGDLGLTVPEVEAIVAFLKTLTDQRYEHLVQ